MNAQRSQNLLVILLRLSGGSMLLATVAIVMPTGWMDAIHQWMGLGSLPNAPIVTYLTRSTSMLYALHGAIYIVLSFDIDRYRPVIRFLALAAIVFGIGMLCIDLYAGMPVYWIIIEGPSIAMAGILFLWLLNHSSQDHSEKNL